MLHAAPTRSTLRAAAVLAAVVLAACGTSRETAGGDYLCGRCHGDAARPALVEPSTLSDAEKALVKSAPPRAISGATATTELGVGAHQAHLVGGRLRGPIPCGECHVVPADMQAHEAGIAAIAAGTAQRVTFGTLADTGAAVAAWDRTTQKCSNLYCHGATIAHGGSNHEPAWTLQDPTHLSTSCGSCHGFPPPSPHPANNACSSCHSASVDAGWGIVIVGGVSTHLDGLLTIDATACSGGGCACCHGAPPATGAHLAHVNTTPTTYGVDSKTSDTLTAAATIYDFGCGNCHPTDGSQHTGGAVDLTPTSGTVGSLKAHNSGTAAYSSITNTCDGVYCHSSGQATPTFKPTPGWFSGASLGCDGCHANPPNYTNGGPGAASANGHVALWADGTYEWGHYAGFPGVSHENSKHGGTAMATTDYWYGQSSAPITCQTCHYDTADKTNTGPSGFYYLDVTGNYELSDAGLVYTYACASCHDGTKAPVGTGGRVMPFFHVNGTRDVRFDPRTDLTGMDATYLATKLPASPNTPTRPYWYSNGAPAMGSLKPLPADVLEEGTSVSMHLGAAGWNASTKTCSSVTCHFKQTSVQWGGTNGTTTAACYSCHTL